MSLDELIKNLKNWRKNKKHKMERVPSQFWDAAIELSKNYPPSLISTRTGLNSTDLKKKLGLVIDKKKSQNNIIFKKLNAPSIEQMPIFELKTASGILIKVYQ